MATKTKPSTSEWGPAWLFAEPEPAPKPAPPTPAVAAQEASPLPWRAEVANWPLPWRQEWADRAEALQLAGVGWREAEERAYEEMTAS